MYMYIFDPVYVGCQSAPPLTSIILVSSPAFWVSFRRSYSVSILLVILLALNNTSPFPYISITCTCILSSDSLTSVLAHSHTALTLMSSWYLVKRCTGAMSRSSMPSLLPRANCRRWKKLSCSTRAVSEVGLFLQ